ncbi:MAG: nucleotidyltransferase family protein [Verrucomicrobia bacterium]|nr:nucleotidyltransferase family protein [Verrucomicrobiota bacterium]
MGRPKQLVEVSGEPLLRKVVRTVIASPADHVIVVLGSNAGDCVGPIRDCGVDIVTNPFWTSGLASSIRIGVERAEAAGAKAVLLVLADQPCISSQLVCKFLNQDYSRLRLIVAARYAGVLGPPLLFGADWFPDLKALEGDQGGRKIVENAGDLVIPIDWPEGQIDIDTPEDLEKTLEMFARDDV